MAYTPHDWETGEVITEELLDHMEEGITDAGNVFIIEADISLTNSVTLNKTYNDIKEAYLNGKILVVKQIVHTTPSPSGPTVTEYYFLNYSSQTDVFSTYTPSMDYANSDILTYNMLVISNSVTTYNVAQYSLTKLE